MTQNNSRPKPRVPTRPGQVIKHGKDKQRARRPSQAELFDELEEERNNDNQHRPYPSEEEEEYYANKVYGGTGEPNKRT